MWRRCPHCQRPWPLCRDRRPCQSAIYHADQDSRANPPYGDERWYGTWRIWEIRGLR